MSKAKQLRELLTGPEIVVKPGVYDGFSTRLVEKLGFKTAGISGAGLSETNLGWPDVGLMGYELNVESSAQLAACVSIPLWGDGDTGYGNSVNAFFTVQGFERAGVVALTIEDQAWPKRCGHLPGKEVISTEEGAEKIRAATEARHDPDFVIVARTDATATHGLKESIRRLNIYAEAGADLLYADALFSREDIATLARNISKPLVVNMGFGIRSRPTTPLIPARELQDLGVKVVAYPRILTAAAIQGMKKALAALMESIAKNQAIDSPDLVVSFQELNDLMGLGTIKDLEDRFLTPGQLEAKYGTSK